VSWAGHNLDCGHAVDTFKCVEDVEENGEDEGVTKMTVKF